MRWKSNNEKLAFLFILCENIPVKNIFNIILPGKRVFVINLLFQIRPENQSASLSCSGEGRPDGYIGRTLITQADVKGYKVLPPHGVWETETSSNCPE